MNSIRTIFTKLANFVHRREVSLLLAKAGVPKAASIPTYTSPKELTSLLMLAQQCRPGATIIELGSHLGASTCYLATGLASKGGRIYCIDTWQNETMPEGIRDTFNEFSSNTAGVKHLIIAIRKSSHELNETDIHSKADLVFIDADHSYAAVKKDFERIKPFLRPDSIIAFHDCDAFQGVSRVIGEILAEGRFAVAGKVDNLLWMRYALFTDNSNLASPA